MTLILFCTTFFIIQVGVGMCTAVLAILLLENLVQVIIMTEIGNRLVAQVGAELPSYIACNIRMPYSFGIFWSWQRAVT